MALTTVQSQMVKQNSNSDQTVTALGVSALNSNSASYNTALGYQAGYSTTTGGYSTFIGYQAGYNSNWNSAGTAGANTCVGALSGYNLTTGRHNNFFGSGVNASGYEITTGSKNTILGSYSGNQGGVDIRTVDNNIVMSDGDGNPRLWYYYASSTVGQFRVRSHTTADSTNATFIVANATGNDLTMEAGNASVPSISGVMRVAKNTANSRSINAAGTVNQNGADYAEYMTKAGDFTIAKGDVVGIDANGKLTNVFADAISFCVKSTDPGLVGGDNWFTEPRPKGENGDEVASDTAEYQAWFARMEEARAKVDRIAFCGQIPVNVTGATAGQYIIPVNDNGTIKGEAISNPTFEQYQIAVGKVIAIEEDGRAKIIVKVS